MVTISNNNSFAVLRNSISNLRASKSGKHAHGRNPSKNCCRQRVNTNRRQGRQRQWTRFPATSKEHHLFLNCTSLTRRTNAEVNVSLRETAGVPDPLLCTLPRPKRAPTMGGTQSVQHSKCHLPVQYGESATDLQKARGPLVIRNDKGKINS